MGRPLSQGLAGLGRRHPERVSGVDDLSIELGDVVVIVDQGISALRRRLGLDYRLLGCRLPDLLDFRFGCEELGSSFCAV